MWYNSAPDFAPMNGASYNPCGAKSNQVLTLLSPFWKVTASRFEGVVRTERCELGNGAKAEKLSAPATRGKENK